MTRRARNNRSMGLCLPRQPAGQTTVSDALPRRMAGKLAVTGAAVPGCVPAKQGLGDPTVNQQSSTTPARSQGQPERRRPRHLMDPNAPRPVRDLAAEKQKLSRVQKWVMSTLAVTTILHMAVGLIIAAMIVPERSGQIGLNIIAGAFGVMAVAAGLAIHGRHILSPWLLLGTVPAFIGLWLTFG